MTDDLISHLKSLHTSAIDARNGYDAALNDAEGTGLTSLFREMIALHTQNADELAEALRSAGQLADDSGSFMSTVHRTIMSVRSLFNGLGESVIPGLVDGEQRNIASYDEALGLSPLPESVHALLNGQRNRLSAAVSEMKSISDRDAS